MVAVFLFDQSSNHKAFAKDALVANRMNMNAGAIGNDEDKQFSYNEKFNNPAETLSINGIMIIGCEYAEQYGFNFEDWEAIVQEHIDNITKGNTILNVDEDIIAANVTEVVNYFALLLRDFIYPWYRMLTTDEDISTEILDISTLLVQKLEKRLFQEYSTRQTKKRVYIDHGSGCESLSESFHGMQPHFALQPVEHREQEYLRLLTESLLKALLQPKGCQSDCVRHLVREILSKLVLYNLIEVLSDPYTIHMIICKLLSSYESGQFMRFKITSVIMVNNERP
ncbi:PXA domain-containing protein [Helicostylum pulchrum]|nr:PXA domain-containing protein [Helicostylum pulchrum]